MSKSVEIIFSIVEFVSMISGGFLIALIFDVFRKMRKAVRRNNSKNFAVTVYVQDVFFLIFSFLILVFMIYRVNGGKIDWYISLGCISGAITYYYLAEPLAGRIIFSVFFIIVKMFKIVTKIARIVICKLSRKKKKEKIKKNDFFMQKALKKAGETQIHDI